MIFRLVLLKGCLACFAGSRFFVIGNELAPALQEENDHVGEQNGQRTGHKMHLGNQVCGDDPSGLKKQADGRARATNADCSV